MRKNMALVFRLVLVSAMVFSYIFTQSKPHLAHASPYTSIDVNTAHNMITNGSFPDLTVLDVRTKSEYDSGHIYKAVWIPVTELESRIGELATHIDHEIIVYCATGARSAQASSILDFNNFTKVYNMLEGIPAWKSAGYPVWIAAVHNLNSTFNYDTIQAAINAPHTLDGHTIFVEEGTYYEHVIVGKSLTITGENKDNTTIDGSGVGKVVRIIANNTRISEFTIRKGGFTPWGSDSGIYVNSSDNTITDNIIVNNDDWGIWLDSFSRNNTIARNNITENWRGCMLNNASDNSLSENIIVGHGQEGISLWDSINNTISDNNISDNTHGVDVYSSQWNNCTSNYVANNIAGISISSAFNNRFWHNNMINNLIQVDVVGTSGANFWDDEVEGNYWSNDTHIDSNHDGIDDSPHVINADNQDNHALVGPFSSLNASRGYAVNVVSNSTIEDFCYFESNSTIKMRVSNMTADQTYGFCRVTIPHALVDVNNLLVIIDNGSTSVLYFNNALYDNGTHRWIYFAYAHSKHEIAIISEFPSFIILAASMTATLLTFIACKRRCNQPSARQLRIQERS